MWTCLSLQSTYRDVQELNQWEKILQGKQKKNKFSSPLNLKDDALPINTRLQNEAAPGNVPGESRFVLYDTNEVIVFRWLFVNEIAMHHTILSGMRTRVGFSTLSMFQQSVYLDRKYFYVL